MRKIERHRAIQDLIRSQGVNSQTELARLLSSHGFDVTQASVSRDLEELNIAKVNGHYAVRVPDEREMPEFGLVSVARAGHNLIVLKCRSGLASAAAVRIDGARIEEITGTIAGDDTIFIAVNGETAQSSAIRKINRLFGVV